MVFAKKNSAKTKIYFSAKNLHVFKIAAPYPLTSVPDPVDP
jgi:hypothetical protein